MLASRRAVMCLAAAAAFAPPAWAEGEPARQLIEKVAAEVIELIKNTRGAEREAGIRHVLETYFDMRYMGQSALATQWGRTTPDQKERYLRAVVTSEARAYNDRFSQYGGQTLAVTKVAERAKGVWMVDSKLNQTNGEPINIQWEVRDSGQGLRITDVRIEGVSMVQTKRSEFSSFISSHRGEVEPLIQELETRAAH